MNFDNLDNNIYILQPNQEDLGLRIDKYLSIRIADISRTRIKNLIEAKHLLNNDKILTDCSYIIKECDNFKLSIPTASKTTINPKNIKLDIVFEDEDIIVLNKPVGMTVHPGAGNYDDTLVNALVAYCSNNLSSIGGVERPGIVHRLDKDTSGLMIVAKNDIAHISLSKQLASRELSRVYFALVFGVPDISSNIISTNIARSYRDRTKMIIVKSGGKEAITNYKLIKTYGNQISEIECKLATGRTHQIRVHLAYINHPLVGDQIYGIGKRKNLSNFLIDNKNFIMNFNRQALHAKKIGFFHPKSNEYLEFEAKLPKDIELLINNLHIIDKV